MPKGEILKAVAIPISQAGDVNYRAMEPMEFDNRQQMAWFEQGLITACNMLDQDGDWVIGLYTADAMPDEESLAYAEDQGFF